MKYVILVLIISYRKKEERAYEDVDSSRLEQFIVQMKHLIGAK